MKSASTIQLVDLPESALWTSRTWTDFEKLPPRARAKQVVVLPLFGFADWGLGRPIDIEETLGTAVLRVALADQAAARPPPVVLPPLRFVLGPYPHTLFGIDLETALDLVREVAASVHAAGFRKLVLLNTSPWNEVLIDTAAVDLRQEFQLQTFCINLAALGFDLHPVRSASRTVAQCAACAITGALPLDELPREEISLRDFRPGNVRQPGPLEFDLPLARAIADGEKLLADAGRKLASLFADVDAHRQRKKSRRTPR